MSLKDIKVNCDNTLVPYTRDFYEYINQPCNGTESIYFEDLTRKEAEYSVQISSFSYPPCVMTAIIEFHDGKVVERVIPGSTTFSFFSEDLKRISIRCDGSYTGTCYGLLILKEIFCVN
ncbi:hypothetical protein [Bacillus velezensis]|uniref:hypothetical protein n=1 Tax=Bacillus velezensis TaxID=492670 RepID=UPI0009F51E1C|nr:hypothetical protein [Bacillus velezensis]OQV47751.1 hypothetical protein B5Z20_10865 [Bacillus velezensis]OQV51888.1 hypothetical protein B5Z22_10875 [Bacillus velezensis]OQV58525.1 hypothetical protein B5Z24_10885 [Bacillus velezensis]OQV59403.1 hypothetical protein B5Z23_10485 [Bacillus velezensis]